MRPILLAVSAIAASFLAGQAAAQPAGFEAFEPVPALAVIRLEALAETDQAAPGLTQSRSGLPGPSVWATMMLGVAGAGALLRRSRRRRLYRLVELDAEGQEICEEFPAPDDESALVRARAASDARAAQLWRGDELVARW